MEGTIGMREVSGERPGKKREISGSTLKLTAVAAMLIDHIAAVILVRQIMDSGYLTALYGGATAYEEWMRNNGTLYQVYMVMRTLGRLGFPIFCFLLVEGFQKTRSVKKYGLRLGLFALISEVPFNLAFTGEVTASGYQNVFLTLFLGLFALCCYRFLERCREMGRLGRLPRGVWLLFLVLGTVLPGIYFGIWLGTKLFHTGRGVRDYLSRAVIFPVRFIIPCAVLCVALAIFYVLYGKYYAVKEEGRDRVRVLSADLTALVLLMCLADFLYTDYAGFGVLTVTVMYVFRRNRTGASARAGTMAAGCTVLTLMALNEAFAFVAAVPAALYNGERGLKMKYFFYAFYPVHLLALYLIAVWLGIGDVTPL